MQPPNGVASRDDLAYPGDSKVDATPRLDCIADFLRVRKSDILAAWERAVRELPIARDLERPRLLDHLPELLSRLEELVRQRRSGAELTFHNDTTDVHALERLGVAPVLELPVREAGFRTNWPRPESSWRITSRARLRGYKRPTY